MVYLAKGKGLIIIQFPKWDKKLKYMCHSKCCGGGCTISLISKILLIVGGINWGLVGLGMLMGGSNWNVVAMLLGSIPTLEASVYVLVGIAGVMSIFGCKCKKCMDGACGPATDHKTEGSM